MSRANDPSRPDLYSRITNQIVADLEAGVRPWTKPWSSGRLQGSIGRPLRYNRDPYSGVNVVLLWSEAVASGYTAPMWMTFRQALELGGHVRKGEHGATVVYANRFTRTETDANGAEVEHQVPFLKAYTVFNVEQIDDLPADYRTDPEPALDPSLRIANADCFVDSLGADIRHGGAKAYYDLIGDRIQLPPFESFVDPQAYYATALHELAHWTMHPSRLDRVFNRKGADREAYACEELVAELGAAFLCADLRLELTPREDHAAYIDHWLKVLKGDKRFIFSAAAHAQRAADYLHQRQP